ncbi:conserved hypothetical protein [Deferribacter desulfuricans SSM1]|uniref:diguanylate cyclase n=1 Tax=Deferribacter desulfuricans (strain DSM 14783 / JCM 11476 / NBRC 101012 / SSM1) TaxID=639282 RepID=D3PCL9_DEFDS|nr:sensor domain-containing diguanylate cyclase [Deferribacter desulfuricans]BAI80342.1 conserved hypothetical protein [Deferribacter desulfuricans SSM1]
MRVLNKPKKFKSLRVILFKNITLIFISLFLLLSIYISKTLYDNGIESIYTTLEERNKADKYYIESYFTKIHNAVKILSKIDVIKNAIYLSDNQKQFALKLFKYTEDSDPDINYVYAGYIDGSLLINNYTPPKGYNPMIRPWYIAAIKSFPNVSNGIPYQEIKTKEWLISISKTLVDNNGKIVGVIAIDSDFSKITSKINKYIKNYKSTNSFIIKEDTGEIIITPNNHFLRKKYYNYINNINFVYDHKKISFTLNGDPKLGYYSKIPILGWIIVTSVSKKEVITPIYNRLIILNITFLIMIILFGWFLSKSFMKKIINPLIILNDKLLQITQNKKIDIKLNTFEYPNNEIGIIAKELEKLTTTELYKKNKELEKINQKLQKLSITDCLTKLYNRGKIEKDLTNEYNKAIRYNDTFSIILFDIDNFKIINDTYGHQMGDKILIEIANLTKETIRNTDIAARWGGEEFLILCPKTNINSAFNLAERLRKKIESHDFSIDKRITISGGIAEFKKGLTIDEMLKQADDNLYKAKKEGKNRVIF